MVGATDEDDEQAKLEIQSKLGDYMRRLQTLKSAFQEEEAAYGSEPSESRGEGLPYLRRDSSDSSAILRLRDSSDAESSVGFY